MKLSDLLRETSAEYLGVDGELEITQISSDSRSILKGGLFICIKGTRQDGHDFARDALERGASALVVSDVAKIPKNAPCVVVENTRLAEAYIWDAWYGHPAKDMKVIAVTGTNGKTSTTFMIREIFRRSGVKVGVITTLRAMAGDDVIGTYGGSSVSDAAGAMTTPDPEYLYGAIYLMKKAGVRMLVFEASSHALSQYKIDPLHIDTAVFTNLSEEHLDYHGTMEEYFKAKARLGKLSGCLVINSDDAYMWRLKDMFSSERRVVTCSADSSAKGHLCADVAALRRKYLGVSGVEYIYFSNGAVFRLECGVPGEFTVYNTLLAATAAMETGAAPEVVREALSEMRGVDGRLEKVDLGRDDLNFDVFIDYAHTPAALESLLRTVRGIRERGQKITLLFGCGGDRDRSKRKKMGSVASRLADFVIITSDNPRFEAPLEIIREIISGIDKEKPHAVIINRREAIRYAISEAREGDIIILAGKGHEKYEINKGNKAPFDEAAIVREAVSKYK